MTASRYPLDEPRWCGDDGSPLLVEPLPGITRADVDASVRSQWRYAAALPLALKPVSLGEGCTPLLDVRIDDVDLAVKPEWFNPTASFKDRGTTVMVSLLAHQGVAELLEDSSGNGGASVAAYAAAAGIHAKILAPDSTSEAKTLQSRMHGAELELIPGSRQATADEAVRQSSERFYASHNWHPFFLQGTKLIAYEIWEDLGFHAPDAVLLPAGRRQPRARVLDRLQRAAARRRDRAPPAPARRPARELQPARPRVRRRRRRGARRRAGSRRSPRAPRSPSPCATSRCWRRCARATA